MVTMVVTLALSTYLLIGPAQWLYKLMNLTEISNPFKLFIFGAAIMVFGISYVAEKQVFPKVSNGIEWIATRVRRTPKQRKKYKTLEKDSRL